MKSERTSVKFFLLCTLSLLTFSCAEMATTYMPSNGNISGGYGEDKIKTDIYVVYFDGNGFVTQAKAKKYFLRRSSALTLQAGYTCFKVLDEKRTLHENFKSKAIEVLGSEYYFKDDAELIDTDKNKLDENSLSGVIQIFPAGSEPKDCMNAKSTLEMVRTD